MPAGRPTKFKIDLCDEMLEYFEGQIETGELPLFQDYAKILGIHTDTLNEWCHKHPKFSDAYKKAKEMQESIWIKNSLKGEYNPAFTIFMGKNNFGWRDKHDIEHTGDLIIKSVNYADVDDTV